MTAQTPDVSRGERIVVVLGAPRSGTTWLVRLLAAHPELAGPDPESLMFMGLDALWANIHRIDGEGVSAYVDPDQAMAACRAYCNHIIARARDRERPGATWFVEKTPGHVLWLPLISAIYPDAWYIHVLRDGRDVARSLAKAPFGPDDVGGAAKWWVDCVRGLREHQWRLHRFRELRYEELMGDPVGHMSALFDWLGLPVGDDVAGALEKEAAVRVSQWAPEPVGVGKWQQLDPTERATMQAVAGDVLAQLGYLK